TSKKIQALRKKISFYEARVTLYKDYKEERTLEINEAFQTKINNFLAKNKRLLLTKKYEHEDLEKQFNQTNKLAIDKYRIEMRRKFRIKREQIRRKIKRLRKKDVSQELIAFYENKIVLYEKFYNQKTEEYRNIRLLKFNDFIIKNQDFKLNIEAVDKLEAKLTKKNELFTIKHTKKRDQKLNRINVFCDKKYKKYQKKLESLRNLFEDTMANIPSDNILLAEDVVLGVENLCMFFGGVKAVNDLSFTVKKGEIFGLIGPNGAGKTTVFNCITQFNKPTSGQLYYRNVLGEVINLNKVAIHDIITHGIARTFQNLEIVKEVSVLENLLIAAHRQYQSNFFEHALGLPILRIEEKVIRRRADKILKFMGLSFYRDWFAWGLPYGVLKKLEIARTLMANPHLIILDEPAAGLNDSETKELADLIRKIRDEYKCSIFLVEHDMGLVMDVCDTILAISFGKKLAIGTAKEIQKNKEVQAAYLGVSEDE
ncbi:MAG: ABC transporter ATP-binding protein, partial [Bacilli bacterium]|nr:ABC transporter ATP-binding protein [Bacilli bacterium]